MSESTKIENRNLGYFWNYSIETESVVPVEGTRASAKTTEKFSTGGNTETYEESFTQLVEARKNITEARK